MLSGLWLSPGVPPPYLGTEIGGVNLMLSHLLRQTREKGAGVAGRRDSGVSSAPFWGSSWGWVGWEVVVAHFS